MTVTRLSADAARRIALAAQGFTRPRPTGRVTRQHLRRVFDDIGLIQIDSVNVLVRSQELPLFARLGPHPRTLIPDAVAAGELFEYWAHVASIVPTQAPPAVPLADGGDRSTVATHGTSRSAVRACWTKVLDQVREHGPDRRRRPRGPRSAIGTWWNWDDAKLALEHLFDQGVVSVTRRPNDFARLYDLTERILPAEVLGRRADPEPEARKQLLLLAARSLGVATLKDLSDYHRSTRRRCKPLVAELVADGSLIAVEVEGWKKPAFVHPDAAAPRRVTGRALLSPFDSLVWYRDRTERLFGFHYRIEIYTPQPKRIYGYYVLPFLLDGQLVGRVDLKADRGAGVLRAQASLGRGRPRQPSTARQIAEQLAAELAEMAGWLGSRRRRRRRGAGQSRQGSARCA